MTPRGAQARRHHRHDAAAPADQPQRRILKLGRAIMAECDREGHPEQRPGEHLLSQVTGLNIEVPETTPLPGVTTPVP